ncbi:MAG: OsmC family peroxiredoxin [Saprospiraceae bacterium]|nr:OsmC family peroxiredoxin [Saprospiraceae bacterium]
MIKRHSTALWKGSGKEGTGIVSSQSGVLSEAQYSYKTRFEDGIGTNPEELIAAAHAGCFAMKLSFVLGAAGFTPETLEAKCTVGLDAGKVVSSHIDLKANVPGISAEVFEASVRDAEANCPISVLLDTAISVDYTLEA